MKKQITRTLLVFGMLFVLVATASAQTARRITIQIPFDFIAGRTQMHAGRYIVRRVSSDSESALMIQSEDGRATATVITNSGAATPERAQVVFRQHGDQYFLAEVSMPGTASVRVAPKSGAEKKNDAEGKTVAVAGSIQ
jgi:hypothetical protein